MEKSHLNINNDSSKFIFYLNNDVNNPLFISNEFENCCEKLNSMIKSPKEKYQYKVSIEYLKSKIYRNISFIPKNPLLDKVTINDLYFIRSSIDEKSIYIVNNGTVGKYSKNMLEILMSFSMFELKKNYVVDGYSYYLDDYVISIGQLKTNSGSTYGLILDINYFPIINEGIVKKFIYEVKNRINNNFIPIYPEIYTLQEERQTFYGQQYYLAVKSLLSI